MIILGLDISKHTGFAIFKDSEILSSGTFNIDCKKHTNLVNEYNYIEESITLGNFVLKLISDFSVDKVYIEQTNRGINRHSQKELEFLHYGVLKRILEKNCPEKVNYVDTSAWRSCLKIRLSKDQKKHNKEVREKKKRGKITTKHLVVDWVNTTFKKELILKDNNEADAIAIAYYGICALKHAEKVDNTKLSLQDAFN